MKKNKNEIIKKVFNPMFFNDIEYLKEHISSGFNINSKDKQERTLLMYAVIENNKEIVDYLINVKALLSERDINGWTALHFAAQNYNYNIAKTLLENGALVDIRDSDGNTPLFRAVFNSQGKGEVIEILLRFGANENLENNYGISPIELAKTIANYNVFQFFSK